MAMLYKYIYINNQRVNPPKIDQNETTALQVDLQVTKYNRARIRGGTCSGSRYLWYKVSVENAKPSSIGSNPYELFNLKISPVRNRTSSVFINRIIVVVPLYTQVWWAYLCHFNFFSLQRSIAKWTLHHFTSIYINLLYRLYLLFLLFGGDFYQKNTCCLVASLSWNSGRWHLWIRQPWRLPPPGAWEKGLLPPRPPTPGEGSWEFFLGGNKYNFCISEGRTRYEKQNESKWDILFYHGWSDRKKQVWSRKISSNSHLRRKSSPPRRSAHPHPPAGHSPSHPPIWTHTSRSQRRQHGSANRCRTSPVLAGQGWSRWLISLVALKTLENLINNID